jgi:uncharacterized membrane protein YbhN (UPF0104 family)
VSKKPPSRARRVAGFAGKLVLTGVCLWWAFSQIDWAHSVFRNPAAIAPGWLAAALAMAGISVWFTGLRWWFFLRAQGIEVGMARAWELTLIGNFFSLLSFGGIGGDAARVLLLNREHPGRKLVLTMTVLVDRLAGLVALGGIFFVISAARFEALADASLLGRGAIRFAWFQLGGGLALVLLCFLMASPPIHQWIHGSGRFDRWPMMRRIPEIYDIYRVKWRHALAGVVASVVMFFAFFVSFWCAMRAVGGTVPAGDVVTAMPVIDAISSLPISIAGMGVREKLFEVLMDDLAGVPAATAVAASLLGFACNTFWALLGALCFLRRREHVTVAELERAAEE